VAIDKYSPPKYFQICRKLVSSIQRGELPPGTPVASENTIIERYGVSNTTARKVLHELEKEGWVTRVKGKGTFVRDFPVVRAINRIFGFTRNMIEAGRKPATRLIGFHLREENHSQTINGRLFTLKGPFCEIERLRLADGIPMMKETRYISLSLCPDIQRRNLEQSLYEVFDKHYGIHLTEINQMLSAIVLEGDWLPVFQVDRPIPAFRVEGASFCGKDMIVEMENAVYRGDMYRFAAKAVR
jgi:GntR family transcriptional regulator